MVLRNQNTIFLSLLATICVAVSARGSQYSANMFLNGDYKNNEKSHQFSVNPASNIFLEHAIISRQASPFQGPTYLPPQQFIKCGGGQQCVSKNVCQNGYYTQKQKPIANCNPETDVCCAYRPPATPPPTTPKPYTQCRRDQDCVSPADCQNGEISSPNYIHGGSTSTCYAPNVCCLMPSTTLTDTGYQIKVPEIPFNVKPPPPTPKPTYTKQPPVYTNPPTTKPSNEYLPPVTQPTRYTPAPPQPPRYTPEQPRRPETPRYTPAPPQPPRYTPEQPRKPETPRYTPAPPQPPRYTPEQPRQPETPRYTPAPPQPPRYTPEQPRQPETPRYTPAPPQPPRYTPEKPQKPATNPSNEYLPPVTQPTRYTPAPPQPPRYTPEQPRKPETPRYTPAPPQPPRYTPEQPRNPETPRYTPAPPQPPRYTPAPPQPPRGGYTPAPPKSTQPPRRQPPNRDYLPPSDKDNEVPTESRTVTNRVTVPTTRKPLRGEHLLSPSIVPEPNNVAVPRTPSKCASALLCTPEEYCNSIGVISDTPVNLTPEAKAFRVPLTDCIIPENGSLGKCCRDSNYVDPWPVNMAGVCGNRNRGTKPKGIQDIDANFGEIPWQTMILQQSTKSLLCGGTIIGAEEVLTDADCVRGLSVSDCRVKAGEWELGNDSEPLPFQLVGAKSINIDPAGNIAFIRLDKPLQFATHIKPICISDQDPSPSEQCVTTGWGKSALRAHEQGAIMHVTDTDVQSRSECGVDNGSVCSSTKYDSCQFDVGSGLACGSSSSVLLKGIYRAEKGCGEGQPVTFSKLNVTWVNEQFTQRNKEIFMKFN